MKKIKKFFKMGDNPIPWCVHQQCKRFYILGIIMVVMGLAFSILARDWLSIVITPLLGVIIAAVGYFRERNVSTKGYILINGICERVEYTLTSKVTGSIGRKIPARYIIKGVNQETGEEHRYAIPYYKQNIEIFEGDNVNIYYRKNVIFLEMKGAQFGDEILGYEII